MKPSSTLLRLLGALLVVAIVLGTLDALSVAVPERCLLYTSPSPRDS